MKLHNIWLETVITLGLVKDGKKLKYLTLSTYIEQRWHIIKKLITLETLCLSKKSYYISI